MARADERAPDQAYKHPGRQLSVALVEPQHSAEDEWSTMNLRFWALGAGRVLKCAYRQIARRIADLPESPASRQSKPAQRKENRPTAHG